MPHLIIEYTDNLSPHIQIKELSEEIQGSPILLPGCVSYRRNTCKSHQGNGLLDCRWL